MRIYNNVFLKRVDSLKEGEEEEFLIISKSLNTLIQFFLGFLFLGIVTLGGWSYVIIRSGLEFTGIITAIMTCLLFFGFFIISVLHLIKYLFSFGAIVNKRIHIVKFSLSGKEDVFIIELKDITSIKSHQGNIYNMLLNQGKITVRNTNKLYYFSGVYNPAKIAKHIEEIKRGEKLYQEYNPQNMTQSGN